MPVAVERPGLCLCWSDGTCVTSGLGAGFGFSRSEPADVLRASESGRADDVVKHKNSQQKRIGFQWKHGQIWEHELPARNVRDASTGRTDEARKAQYGRAWKCTCDVHCAKQLCFTDPVLLVNLQLVLGSISAEWNHPFYVFIGQTPVTPVKATSLCEELFCCCF